jgi:peptidoglycan/xylan/chitin deacetylase (PgdA/CDA1 family)
MKSLIKKFARLYALPLAHRMDLGATISNFSSNNLLQITYHGVTKQDYTDYSPRSIKSDIFERQIEYFKKKFDIVSVKEAFELAKKSKTLKRKTIAISFDDCYANNATVMKPIIEAYQVPVTIFICGSMINMNEPRYLWPELIQVMEHDLSDVQFEYKKKSYRGLKDASSGRHINEVIKDLNYFERLELLDFLNSSFNLEKKLSAIPSDAWELMTNETLLTMLKCQYLDFGAHGHWHLNLGRISLEDAIEDLTHSKKTLDQFFKMNIDMIAYPDGCYTRDIIDAAQAIGYTKQLAVNYRHHADTKDLRIMNRHGISSTTTFESTLFFLHRAFASKGC